MLAVIMRESITVCKMPAVPQLGANIRKAPERKEVVAKKGLSDAEIEALE